MGQNQKYSYIEGNVWPQSSKRGYVGIMNKTNMVKNVMAVKALSYKDMYRGIYSFYGEMDRSQAVKALHRNVTYS